MTIRFVLAARLIEQLVCERKIMEGLGFIPFLIADGIHVALLASVPGMAG